MSIEDEVEKIDFDVWWAMCESKIPAHHHKEVIWADFKGRNLNRCESVSTFDEALSKYGLKL